MKYIATEYYDINIIVKKKVKDINFGLLLYFCEYRKKKKKKKKKNKKGYFEEGENYK